MTLYHADLIEALGLEKPHVVGHYSGAMVAAEIAAIGAADIGKIVLAAPAGLWQDDNPGLDYNTTPITETRQALFADADSTAAMSLYPQPRDDEEFGWQIIHRVQSLNAVGKFLWPIPDKGLVRRVHRIKNPTLVVVGDGDKIVPAAYADILTSRIPNSKSQVMKGTRATCSHTSIPSSSRRSYWSFSTSEPVVLFVISNPRPDEVSIILDSESSVSKTHTDRPKPADPLESERRMPRIFL